GLALAAFRNRVRHPDVAVAIDVEPMRIVHQAAAELDLHVAVGIELHDRIECRSTAVLRGAAVERPQALAVGIDLDADGRAPGAARRQLRPILLQLIRIGIGVGVVGLGEYPLSREGDERGHAYAQHQRDAACSSHAILPVAFLLRTVLPSSQSYISFAPGRRGDGDYFEVSRWVPDTCRRIENGLASSS